jgi:hypothetical protein
MRNPLAGAERMCLHGKWLAGAERMRNPLAGGKWQNPGGNYRTKSRSAANGANKFAAAARR